MNKQTVIIPDLGGVDEVTVLEIFVSIGDTVTVDQALMSLESEKASMDVPSDKSGVVEAILVKPGDSVREGTPCLTLVVTDAQAASTASVATAAQAAAQQADKQQSVPGQAQNTAMPQAQTPQTYMQQPLPDAKASTDNASTYASPAVRKIARKLGIDVQAVPGSGRAARVTLEDVFKTLQSRMGQVAQPVEAPRKERWTDPSQFGPCTEKPASKIKKATAAAMARSWEHIVHVTQCDKVDITALEAYRNQHKAALQAQSIRLTMLAFIMKALVTALKQHPNVNAAYQSQTGQLWLKNYYHIGVAVDTPQGLVVPVIQQVDTLSIIDIAKALATMSQRARDGQLQPKDLAGASFTVSSLGGIGGEYFTPIVNSPQTAILGISRSQIQPVWDGQAFQPRLMLPLSLSYDHRVIDGAEAMRFLNDYMQALKDMTGQDLG